MRTIALTPAGKQPLRIAYMMAIAKDVNVSTKTRLIAMIRKAALPALSAVSVLAMCFASIAFSISESMSMLAVMAASAFAFLASLAPMLFGKKGGKL